MCGIFGNIKKDYGSMNLPLFLTLGIHNDTRGGDSSGCFIDEMVYKGVDKEKLFINTIETNPVFELIENGLETQIALGHCRKASVGKINKETAQPVEIYNADGQLDFVLIHNGTISNYKDFIGKIDTHEIFFTDSYVIAHNIYQNGTGILGEYIGAGAFVWVDYRNDREHPETFIFKGASKQKGHTVSEERPLWYVFDEEENELWFSSLPYYLYPYYNTQDVYPFLDNKLYKFYNGKLNIIETFKRDKLPTQIQTYIYNDYQTQYYNTRHNKNTYHYASMLQNDIDHSTISVNNGIYTNKYDSLLNGIYNIKIDNENSCKKWFYKGLCFSDAISRNCFVSLLNQINLPEDDLDVFLLNFPEIANLFVETKIALADRIYCVTIQNDYYETGNFTNITFNVYDKNAHTVAFQYNNGVGRFRIEPLNFDAVNTPEVSASHVAKLIKYYKEQIKYDYNV